MAQSKRRRGDAGKLRRNYPTVTQWKVDWDYLSKLSPAEQAWLADFGDRYYGGDFRESDPETWDAPARSAVNMGKNCARTDLHTVAAAVGRLEEWDPVAHDRHAPEVDGAPTPGYLDSAEYKAARDAFRGHLHPGRKAQEPKQTPEYRTALRNLRKVTPGNP